MGVLKQPDLSVVELTPVTVLSMMAAYQRDQPLSITTDDGAEEPRIPERDKSSVFDDETKVLTKLK